VRREPGAYARGVARAARDRINLRRRGVLPAGYRVARAHVTREPIVSPVAWGDDPPPYPRHALHEGPGDTGRIVVA